MWRRGPFHHSNDKKKGGGVHDSLKQNKTDVFRLGWETVTAWLMSKHWLVLSFKLCYRTCSWWTIVLCLCVRWSIQQSVCSHWEDAAMRRVCVSLEFIPFFSYTQLSILHHKFRKTPAGSIRYVTGRLNTVTALRVGSVKNKRLTDMIRERKYLSHLSFI